MLGDQGANSHWHDHEYQLDPHRLQVSESPRQRGTRAKSTPEAPTAERSTQSTGESLPLLLGEGVNKKKAPLICCVAGCGKDLSREKDYYQRYRVCEEHLNRTALRCTDGQDQRFCQQCGRFHPLTEFDGEKKSCRGKLQEHNNRRRKRPGAAQACPDSLIAGRPRRTRRSATAFQSENDTLPFRSQRLPSRQRAGPFSYLLSGERTTSSSSGAAARGSEHTSGTSTRETGSVQDGPRATSADLSASASIPVSQAHHPDSHTSGDASPESILPQSQPLPVRNSDAQASVDLPLAEWMDKMGRSNGSGPWLDDATMQVVQKLNSAKVQPPHQDQHSSPLTLPYFQEPAVTSLQALYAQLASSNSAQVSPPASALLYSAFDTGQAPQPQHSLFNSHQLPANLSLSDTLAAQRAGFPEVGHPGTRDQSPGLGRPPFMPSDLEPSMQYSTTQGLLDLTTQSVPNCPRQYEQEICRPPSVPLLADPLDFEDGARLEITQDEAALLDALTVLLDGNMTPASTTSALMSPTQQPMEHSYGLHRAVDHAPALPIPTPTAAQLPPHTSQVPQSVLEQSLAQYRNQAQSSMGKRGHTPQLTPADFHDYSHRMRGQYHQVPLQQNEGWNQQLPAPMASALDVRPCGMSAHSFGSSTSTHQPQPLSNGQFTGSNEHGFSSIPGFAGRDVSADLSRLDRDRGHLQPSSHSAMQAGASQMTAQQQQLSHGQPFAGNQSVPHDMAHSQTQGLPYTALDNQLLQGGNNLDRSGMGSSSLDSMLGNGTHLSAARGAVQEVQATMGRVNLKMFDQYPGAIPPHLAPHIMAMLPTERLTFLEGHMRSGCVHLVVDTMYSPSAAHWDAAAAVHRLLAFDPFWRQGSFLLQLPTGAAHWHNGHITKLWDSQELLAATPRLVTGTSNSTMLPCLVSGQPAKLKVQAMTPQAAAEAAGKAPAPAKVLGRYMGKFVVNPDLLNCPDCHQESLHASTAAAAVPGEVSVTGLAGVGVFTLEAEHDCLLSAAQPVVVAPDAATQQDVCSLIERLQLSGHSQETVNNMLVGIGMVLQYQEYLLKDDVSSDSDGGSDPAADWGSAWANSALLSSQDSDISEFPASDSSTHCGVISAAASAAANSNAGSATYVSDDEAQAQQHAVGSPVGDAGLDSLWRSESLRQPAGPEYAPFTHPVYVAHMVQTAKTLVSLCQEEQLPALLQQVQSIASGSLAEDYQPVPQSDALSTLASLTDSASATADSSHAPSLGLGPPSRGLLLSTILESSLGSGSSPSQAASESSRNIPHSPNGSSDPSELGFDYMELPEIIEATQVTGDSAQAGVTSQTTDARGRPVITVVLPEEVRVLKDSAKEVHEEAGGSKVPKGKGQAPTGPEDASLPVRAAAPPATGGWRSLANRMLPARLTQAMMPASQADGVEPEQAQATLAAVILTMMLCALLLLNGMLQLVSRLGLGWTLRLFCSTAMVVLVKSTNWRAVSSKLEQLTAVHPACSSAYSAVLPYGRLVQDAWLQAQHGHAEQWDLIHSCAASCLAMVMIVLTSHRQAASWLVSMLLPATLLLSILPASVWVANQAWYLEHRQRIQLVVRCCHLVVLLLVMAILGGNWTLPWLVMICMQPVEGSSWYHRLGLAEAAVTVCCALCATSSAGLFSLFRGMLLLTYAAQKLLRVLFSILPETLFQGDLPC